MCEWGGANPETTRTTPPVPRTPPSLPPATSSHAHTHARIAPPPPPPPPRGGGGGGGGVHALHPSTTPHTHPPCPGVHPSELLYVSYANAPGGVLPYAIFLHPHSRSVVLAVRGTGAAQRAPPPPCAHAVSTEDLVTDLLSSPQEISGWLPGWVRDAAAGVDPPPPTLDSTAPRAVGAPAAGAGAAAAGRGCAPTLGLWAAPAPC